MQIYYRYNDVVIDDIIKLYMSSIEFRKSFDRELSECISHRYKGYTFCVIDSDGFDTINRYYTLYMEDETKQSTIPIVNINKKAICNYISEYIDLHMLYKVLLRNEKIETLLKL